MIAFRSRVAMVPATALHVVPCTVCSIANCQLQVLLTFEQFVFAVNFAYRLGARWKDSKSNMTWVCLEKGPESYRADMAWNDGQNLHLLRSPWRPVERAGIQSGEEEGEIQVSGLPHAMGFGTLQRTGGGLCSAWHAGEWYLRVWGAWLQTEGSHSHLLEVGHRSGAWVPSFQWKSRTCVISENFSLRLSCSAAK